MNDIKIKNYIKLTPMMNQYSELKKEYPNILLFYRVGDFYEMFYNDAIKASKILNIVLTKKYTTKNICIPMAGIPVHSIENYLLKLINAGESIAICEQTDKTRLFKNKILERKIVRIITPGTVSDDYLLKNSQDNLLASICFDEKLGFGYATLNMSSGNVQVIENKNYDIIAGELYKTNPVELLCTNNFNHTKLIEKIKCIKFRPLDTFNYEVSYHNLCKQFGIDTLKNIGIINYVMAIKAAGCILQYIKETQRIFLPHINTIILSNYNNEIIMDNNTRKNLEIIKNIYGNKQHTLFYIINHTKTSMGSRLLQRWLNTPILDINIIYSRQNSITVLIDHYIDLQNYLSKIGDIERIIARLSLQTAKPQDFVILKKLFVILPNIHKKLKQIPYCDIKKKILEIGLFTKLNSLLNNSISNNPANSIKYGNVIAQGYSIKLDKLRKQTLDSAEYLNYVEKKERKKLDIEKLKIGYNTICGYYIQIPKNKIIKLPQQYILIQTLKHFNRYNLLSLTMHQKNILSIKEQSLQLEKQLYNQLFQYIQPFLKKLQKLSLYLSELDVLSNLAERSITLNYNKPIISKKKGIFLTKSRHPVVEHILKTPFIPNDICLNSEKYMLMITGPNMGGKSTYMRQVALIIIMTYIGSYVPAKQAIIGPIDRIFTRIGSYDNISLGLSTFMIEMMETSNILLNATTNSLVLMDEIGRGTSTYDGLAIAWACAENIAVKNKSMTLFATNYIELTNLSKNYACIINIYFDAIKFNNSIIFLYTVKKGIISNNYGLFVASLAGIPQTVINNAKRKIQCLKKENNNK
ncbi:DNA mismatch repair protein MutS [Enterobacteriaceae endosymbiont of Neohaemonia nigricornis]|uniref:DNA mismatch repair protein MutS n=1 Tax=Enterobacteriaceae endosymbiont of Neohaemonia nigricornis TaxID=2675792 RepID=UPI0014492389|nr:DNA mismatch repair protein MutS [Enterobacteriaceae endosymbiont of Neohaemonia nigricornis]QJC30336.1 DNA mismatch repair protein MutS [Enterobacteriaceae endosymbiont of Neohaemonia nigricornis]